MKNISIKLSQYFFIVFIIIFSAPSMALKIRNWTLYTLKVKCDSQSWTHLKWSTGKIDCGQYNGITIVRGAEPNAIEKNNGCELSTRYLESYNLHKKCLRIDPTREDGLDLTINGFPTDTYICPRF